MKKKSIFLSGGLLLAILIAAFGCSHRQDTNTLTTQLYFLNAESTTLVPEEQTIGYETEYDIPRLVVEALCKGPQEKNHRSVLDADVEILSLQVENGAVTCNFSKNFVQKEPGKTVLSAYAVIKTLCQIDDVHTVQVLAGGEEITGPDGKPIRALSDQDINLEDDSESPEAKDVVLYFASKDKKHLVKEQRTIRITDKQPVEQYIVNALIQGPENKDAGAVLSSDTTLVSAQTTDGTCFVNFKSNFADKNTGTPEKEIMAIYSIVNSLTELEDVRNVQFLIDGKKTDNFGSISIRECVYPNEALIER